MSTQSAIALQEPFSQAPSTGETVPYLDKLNPSQRQAVEATDGPVLVLAGAGTGKTRVLTSRLVHILSQQKAYPSQILAVTFTNKAAHEMRERIAAMIGSVEGMWLGTFHSLCVRILRRHAEAIGLHPSFTILDQDDQVRLIKQLMKAENIDDKKWPPRMLVAIISRWKDQALSPEKVTASASHKRGADDPAVMLYAQYQERLATLNAVDFGDLIFRTLELFQKYPDILATYQKQFKYILVDEYQDTNVSQYLWLRLLAIGHNNLCCVGDDDQSIYGWRGAQVSNILRFEKDFPGALVVKLEENYRSTPHILGAASGLIAKNAGRLGKSLWTQKDAGDKVLVKGVWDGGEEARFVGQKIEDLHRSNESLGTMAILVRASFQTREFEDRFIALGIPYRVVGGARFYERQEIRDALAYFRVIAQEDDGIAFERIMNTPRRGIGNSTVQLLHHYARVEGVSLTAAAKALIHTDDIRGKARTSLQTLLNHFTRWREMARHSTPAELAQVVLDEAGYTAMLQEDKSPEAPARLDNLKELVRALGNFENLYTFLEHVSLVMDNNANDEADKVSLMTMHSAKGLEFDTVFLPGWEEELFPSPRSLTESGTGGLEEERRLAYVGLTRAKKRAVITYANNRLMYGRWQATMPSRFIEELPHEHVMLQKASSAFMTPPRMVGGGISPMKMVNPTPEPMLITTNFSRGDRVFHIKFGYGEIKNIEGDKLEIDFDKAGVKKVMASFVEKK